MQVCYNNSFYGVQSENTGKLVLEQKEKKNQAILLLMLLVPPLFMDKEPRK